MRNPLEHEVDWEKYSVASFDVFDTLVERLVCSPSDVFRIVEARALRKGWDAVGFSRFRVEAERAARAVKDGEITLDEIYASFDGGFQDHALLDQLRELELEVEKAVCVRKDAGMSLYEEARHLGKPLAITSDMYLPASFIVEVLERCGYVGWTKIFVSCERAATKAAGDLYPLVAGEMGFPPSQIVHFGDNAKSDYLRARAAGFGAYHIAARRKPCATTAESFIRAAAKPVNSTCGEDLYRTGYSFFGPLLLGFSVWLRESLLADKVERAFFLARDGLVMERAFNVLFPAEFDTRYLYASRRALQVPSFSLLDSFDEIVGSLFLPRMISLEKLFIKMGLDAEFVCAELAAAGIDPQVECRSTDLTTNLEARCAYEVLEGNIKENSKRELRLLQKYLRQSGFHGRCAVVDIGWFGNMQVALERVIGSCGIPAEVTGYYVGLQPGGKNQLTHSMRGYLFDGMHGANLARDERNFNLIFETLFSACHGTTRGYKASGSEIVPLLAPYGGWEKRIGEQAEEMRMGALEFVRDAKRVFDDAIPSIEPQLAFEGLNALGNRPSLKEACYFGDWAMEADESLIYAAKPNTLAHYMMHPKQLMVDFGHASWKVGYLKRLFKLPLPYNRLWNLVHGEYVRRHRPSLR